jgi:hypothetical protein
VVIWFGVRGRGEEREIPENLRPVDRLEFLGEHVPPDAERLYADVFAKLDDARTALLRTHRAVAVSAFSAGLKDIVAHKAVGISSAYPPGCGVRPGGSVLDHLAPQ